LIGERETDYEPRGRGNTEAVFSDGDGQGYSRRNLDDMAGALKALFFSVELMEI